MDLRTFRDERDDSARALFRASSAADALLGVDDREAIPHRHSSELADPYACAEPHAPESTGRWALAWDHCGFAAVRDPVVDAVLCRLIRRAFAFDEGHFRILYFGGDAEHGGYLRRNGSSARGAAVRLRFASDYRLGKSVAAGKSASAAVSAGKDLTNFRLAFVDLYSELLGRERKQDSEDNSKSAHYRGRVNNSCHLHRPLLYDTAETHKGNGHQPGCDERDWKTAQTFRHISVHLYPLTDTRHEQYREKKSERRAERVDERGD